MTAPGALSLGQRLGVLPLTTLAAALALLGLTDGRGAVVGLLVASVGLAISVLWRWRWPSHGGGVEFIPAAAALAYLVLAAPLTVISEVLSGFAGLALLLWLADVSPRASGRLGRALDELIMPMAGFAIALGIAFIIPTGPLSLGLASLLLVLVVVLVVLILARPSIVGRREAPSS